jgi:hypothetical protein
MAEADVDADASEVGAALINAAMMKGTDTDALKVKDTSTTDFNFEAFQIDQKGFFPALEESLQDQPMHIEKYSSFISDSHAPDLLDALEEALGQLKDVDEANRISSYRIQAKVNDELSPCCFYVFIYRSREKSGI